MQVRDLGRPLEAACPRLHGSGRDRRLGDVVDDEGKAGEPVCQLGYEGQVLRAQQEVIGQPAAREFAESAQDIGSQQPAIIGLIVNRMADTLEAGMLLESVEAVANARVGQVNPRDHTQNERVRIGEFEQPFGLSRFRGCLHGHAPVHAVVAQDRAEHVRQEVLPERRGLGGHPRIGKTVELPEVLVGVDTHQNHQSTAGDIHWRWMRKLVIVLAVVLAGCRGKPDKVFIDPALATLVPSDTVFLAGIRLDKLRDTRVYKHFVTERPLKSLDEFQQETGLDPRKDLWEFLVAGNGKETLAFCRGKFAEFGLEPKLNRPGVQRMSYKGMLMLGNERNAVLFVNASVAVAGATPTLRNLVDHRDSGSGIPDWLQKKIDTIPPGSQVWAAGDVTRSLGGLTVQENGTAGNFAQFAPAIDWATAGIDFSDGMKLSAVALCKTDQDASRLNSTVRAGVGFARLNTPSEETQLMGALDAIKSEVKDGRTVTLNATLTAGQLDKLIAFAESRHLR